MNVSRIALKGGALVAAFALLPGAKGGCGSKEANETLASPVQGIGMIIERADGTVGARLVVISTNDRDTRFADAVDDPTVRSGEVGPIALPAADAGQFAIDSSREPSLRYVAGDTYQFRFGLDDGGLAGDFAGREFVGVVDAPDDAVSFQVTEAPAFAGDTAELSWAPAARFGLVTVRDASGAVTYTTFDLTHPEFDGSKWGRLKAGGKIQLSVDTFPTAGTYTLSVCPVVKVSDFDKSLSASLGVLSGLLAGRCAPDQTLEVP